MSTSTAIKRDQQLKAKVAPNRWRNGQEVSRHQHWQTSLCEVPDKSPSPGRVGNTSASAIPSYRESVQRCVEESESIVQLLNQLNIVEGKLTCNNSIEFVNINKMLNGFNVLSCSINRESININSITNYNNKNTTNVVKLSTSITSASASK